MFEPIKFAVIGIDHRHAFGMSVRMIEAGAQMAAWCTEGTPETLVGFIKRCPDVPRLPLEAVMALDVDLLLIAAIPADRAEFALKAMEAGAKND